MGFTGERIAEAIQSAFGNVGQALLSNLAQKREQEQFDERQALAERGVDLQAQQLAQAKEAEAARLAQNYTLHGFQQPSAAGAMPSPAPSDADSQLFHPDVMRGASLPSFGASAPNVGGALLSAMAPAPRAPVTTSPAPDGPAPVSAPPAWMYNPDADPAAILAAREAAARAAEAKANRETQVQVARIGDQGATARNAASIAAQREIYGTTHESPRAQAAAATLLLQNGNDPQKALQAIAGDPDTPAKREILSVLQGLYFDQQKRGALGIGGNQTDQTILDALKRAGGN